MNLIAMIGTVHKIKKEEKFAKVTLKIEKPFVDSFDSNDFFDEIEININSAIFAQDLKQVDIGTLIGLKGRIRSENDSLQIIAEKIQIF